MQVSVEDQRAVLVSLLADVAQNYLELRGAQARRAIAQENLATLDDLLQLTRQRRAAGLTTELDVRNATAQVSPTRAALPALELQITQGDPSAQQAARRRARGAARRARQRPRRSHRYPPQVPIGLPAELARRRPDIREAEANLHAATAQIGVAVGDLFPRLTLSASGGFQSETLGKSAAVGQPFGCFGPALDMPVFDRGRWKTVQLYRRAGAGGGARLSSAPCSMRCTKSRMRSPPMAPISSSAVARPTRCCRIATR